MNSELVRRLLDIALEEPNTPKAKVIVEAADAIERLEHETEVLGTSVALADDHIKAAASRIQRLEEALREIAGQRLQAEIAERSPHMLDFCYESCVAWNRRSPMSEWVLVPTRQSQEQYDALSATDIMWRDNNSTRVYEVQVAARPPIPDDIFEQMVERALRAYVGNWDALPDDIKTMFAAPMETALRAALGLPETQKDPAPVKGAGSQGA